MVDGLVVRTETMSNNEYCLSHRADNTERPEAHFAQWAILLIPLPREPFGDKLACAHLPRPTTRTRFTALAVIAEQHCVYVRCGVLIRPLVIA